MFSVECWIKGGLVMREVSQRNSREGASADILPAKEGWHISIDGSDNAQDIHRIPHRERLAGDMRDDHPSDNMRKL